MALFQFIAGTTVDLLYDFITIRGEKTNVDNPYAHVYTPERSLYQTVNLSAVSGVTGQYSYPFLVPTGATIGHWSTLGVGFTVNSNLFSQVQPFSIVDLSDEPLFIGVQDLRDYLAVPETDYTKNELYKRILLTAISLIEQYLQRRICVHTVSEKIHITNSPVVMLEDYPVISISGMTVSTSYNPAIPSTPNTQSVSSTSTTDLFYFDLKKPAGILDLMDSEGNESIYSGYHIEIDYVAGYMTVPESVRSAILMLASGIFNISQSEGLAIVRFSDLQFTFSKGLFTDIIKDALINLKRVTLR